MSDDQGWGDAGFQGHPNLLTPALDDMASNGIVFRRFYAASAVCSPTRGSVITGRHPSRYGICSANCGHIPEQEVTLAELAQAHGYTTGHFGKWHLGTLTKDTVDANRGGRPEHDSHYAPPWDHGFEVSFSTESKVPTWDPMIVPPKTAGDVKPTLVEGEAFGTYYWNGPASREQHNLRGDDSRIIMDRVVPFIQHAATTKKPFLSVIWFHSPHLPVLTGKQFTDLYPDLEEDQRQFYGTISAMDQQIGRLRQLLRQLEIEQETIIFFTSDNGPEGKAIGGRTQGSTGGLKGRKRSLYEGGIRVPGVVEWPGTLAPGVINTPCFTSDYFPTLINLIGVSNDLINYPLDGIDLMPLLLNTSSRVDRHLVFRFNNQVAVINGNYKLYSADDGVSFQLYDLANDPGENYQLSIDSVAKADEMIAHWNSWEQSVLQSLKGRDYF